MAGAQPIQEGGACKCRGCRGGGGRFPRHGPCRTNIRQKNSRSKGIETGKPSGCRRRLTHYDSHVHPPRPCLLAESVKHLLQAPSGKTRPTAVSRPLRHSLELSSVFVCAGACVCNSLCLVKSHIMLQFPAEKNVNC